MTESPCARGARFVLSVMAAAALAFPLLGVGLLACCSSTATAGLAEAFSRDADSPYDHSQLVTLAEATRDFTVGRSSEGILLENVGTQLADVDPARMPGVLTEGQASLFARLDPSEPAAYARAAGIISDRLSLDDAALSHLDQVRSVVGAVESAMALSFLAALSCVLVLWRIFGRSAVGDVFAAASCLCSCFLIAAGTAAALSFDSFFTTLHSIFFARGTWTFPADSLLITMYPEDFWIGMGIVWLASTIVVCGALLAAGMALRRNAKDHD